MTLLITGGTGSLSRNIIKYLFDAGIKKIIVYSRDEHKQAAMEQEFGDLNIRYFIGDVRDYERLRLALRGVDYVIHAAALKSVPSCEYNPIETIKTNIDGTKNVVMACVENDVKRAVMISTDKAVEPINIYGVSKAMGEKLWISSNSYKKIFSCTRYGNVSGSVGSVIPFYKKLVGEGRLMTVTDERMTRFMISYKEAYDTVFRALQDEPGNIYINPTKSYNIMDLVKYFGGKHAITGIRKGEKIHEKLCLQYEDNIKFIDGRDYGSLISKDHVMKYEELRSRLDADNT